MKKIKEYSEFLLESAPRIPNDINYWKNKGKSGKDVCIIFHDDLDGVVSCILMKGYLENKGFNIKTYAIINYQESWEALKLDPKLINIALDYAEDAEDVDVYIDHHGSFEEDIKLKQQRPAIKTDTGSAAEGIAIQLGIPFSKEIKDWIDMIDSAKYYEYDVNISDILNFDLKEISKDENSKLRFASAFNQLLKRSDYTTFIEVVNASKGISIYNLFRLFKIFFPKNNPNWRSGIEADFVEDARLRLKTMQSRTRGKDVGKEKVRYETQKEFWDDFSKQISGGWKLSPGNYQLIGNLMFIPSGTWANALRAKAIFVDDKKAGFIPEDSKLNFQLLQYGNTLQIADLETKILNMKKEDLPRIKSGIIDNLGKYMSDLVGNFEKYFDYSDKRIRHGGHDGIGTISNIFGKCKVKPYEGIPFLDLFKNKVINDISGVKWSIGMPWNDEEKPPTIKEEDINMRMLSKDEIRSEKDATQEKNERRHLSWIVVMDEFDIDSDAFQIHSIGKIYSFLKSFKNDADYGFLGEWLTPDNISKIWFKDREKDIYNLEKIGVFIGDKFLDEFLNRFDLNIIYDIDATSERKRRRKEAKRLLILIGNIMRGEYIRDNKEKYRQKYKKWRNSQSN